MAFDNTQGQIDQGRKALLEAVARAGSAGKEAYDRANASVNTAQQQAASQALQQSQISNMAPNSSHADSVAALYKSNLAAGQARFGDDLARRQMATEDYLTKLGAALPMVQKRMDEEREQNRQTLETDLALRQSDADAQLALQKQDYEAKQQQAALDREWEMEKRAWEREDQNFKLQERAAKAAAGGGGDELSDSELRTRLMGAGRLAAEETKGSGFLGRAQSAIKNVATPGQQTKSPEEWAREIGLASNIDPARVYGLITDPVKAVKAPPVEQNIMNWAKTDQKTAQTILKDAAYNDTRTQAANFLRFPVDEEGLISGSDSDYDGMTPWEAYVTFVQASLPSHKTRTYSAIVNEFAPIFQASGRK